MIRARLGGRGPLCGDRDRHEQQADQGARRPRDGDEEVPVGGIDHPDTVRGRANGKLTLGGHRGHAADTTGGTESIVSGLVAAMSGEESPGKRSQPTAAPPTTEIPLGTVYEPT